MCANVPISIPNDLAHRGPSIFTEKVSTGDSQGQTANSFLHIELFNSKLASHFNLR